MGLLNAIQRIFGGDLSRLEAQHAAQQIPPMEFPAELTLGDQKVLVRPVDQGDREAILQFARALPEHDLLFLRRDITKPENVDEWLAHVAAGSYVSLVAYVGDALVGYATVASDGMTWTRHVAELRLLLAPSVRGMGLGRILTEQCFRIAQERGIRKIIAQMTTDQQAAMRTFERLGFEREAVLRDQVIDTQGSLHDLQIMGLDLARFQTRLAVARSAISSTPPL